MVGTMFVVDGPSGAGKSHLIRHAVARFPGLAVIAKRTTRPRQSADRQGPLADIEHVSREAFEALRLDYRYRHGDYDYGFGRAELEQGLASNGGCLVVVRDLATIRRLQREFARTDVVAIHVDADPETRRRRLLADGLAPAEVERRMKTDADPPGADDGRCSPFRYRLDNDGSADDFERRVEALIAAHL